VLDAARGAFASDGLAVPLDEIARRAGVGPGTVYRHYPTKDALFAAVILDVLESVRDQANALAKSPDAGEAFFTFFAQLIETGATNKAIFDALSGASPEVQTASRAVSAELGSALAELLARAQRANTVRGDVTPDDLNALVLGALAAQTAVAPGGSPQRLIQVTCDGLRPPA
jgi:AcrR family transcriptional regulator